MGDVGITYSKEVVVTDPETGETKRSKEAIGQVTYNMPDSVEEAIQRFGEEVALDLLNANLLIRIRAVAKGCDSVDAAQGVLNSWIPGVSRERESGGVSMKAIAAAFKGLSAEKRAEILASIASGF